MVEDFMCNLKVYRVAQGLTQEQLAEKVGVRRETIMRLEKAQYNPSLKLAIDILHQYKSNATIMLICIAWRNNT